MDYLQLLKDPAIDAVTIATPSVTHALIAKEALLAGKHVLVEKPLCLTAREAETLCRIAQTKERILMVGHTFLFHSGIHALKKFIHAGQLGIIHYLHSERTNLGPIRQDVNVLIDLAPHDISIFIYLLDQMPKAVAAQGASYIKKGREDVAFINLFFPNNILANILVSWIEPCKVRRITVIGSRKMAVFDDVNLPELIKIYDKGVMKPKRYSDFGEFQLVLRDGDIHIPKIVLSEPLKTQCQTFLHAIERGRLSLSDATYGWKVVRVMEAAQRSLRQHGRPVPLSS